MRWPWLVWPAEMPANSSGTTSPSSSETIQRTGRSRHDFAVEQRDHPAHRADESFGRLATPIHALRPVETGDFFGERFRKNFAGRAPRLLRSEEHTSELQS